MTRSELIQQLATQFPQLTLKDVELTVRTLLDEMSRSLPKGNRIEIRGLAASVSIIALHARGVTPRAVRPS